MMIQDEGLGIFTLIAVIILAILSVYYYYGHSKPLETSVSLVVPTEAPVPLR